MAKKTTSKSNTLSELMDSFEEAMDESCIWEVAKQLTVKGDESIADRVCSLIGKKTGVAKRAASAYVLGYVGSAASVDLLIKTLENVKEDTAVRGHAAEALGMLRDARAFDCLMKALADASVEVRFWSAYALGELGDARAVAALERLAKTDNAILTGWWPVKKEAAKAIASIRKSRKLG